jgi:SAM-dependent methyltransferase
MTFTWDEIRRGPDGKTLLIYRLARPFMEGHVRPGMRVLDVGGWGVFAHAAIERGARCVILDKFTEDQAYPDRVRSLPHVEGDVLNAETFDPETFDVVTCFETLEHVGNIPAALRSMHSWLKPGGVLVGTVPLPGHIHHGDPTCDVPDPERLVMELIIAGFTDATTEPSASIHRDDSPICTYFKARK